jgi:membrane protein YdbS with pleckstrin-like domain
MAEPARVEERQAAPRRLDHRMAFLWGIRGSIVALLLGVLVFWADVGLRLAGVELPWPPGAPAAALTAGLLGLAWWWARADYRNWSYVLADDVLELRHGVVSRVHSAIPYFRVQHVDITQGPLERALGISRLVIHTASAATDAAIPGIGSGEAEGLRRVILARTGSGDAV